METLLPQTSHSEKTQEDQKESEANYKAKMLRLMNEQRAQSDNSWQHLCTQIKDLRRRILVVEDLQEETEVTPEKFVTEESFETWKERHGQLFQVAVDNEKDGRLELEKRLKQVETTSENWRDLSITIKHLEANATTFKNSIVNATKVIRNELTGHITGCNREPPEDRASTSLATPAALNHTPISSESDCQPSCAANYEGILEALLFELHRKFGVYDAKLVQYDDLLQLRENTKRQVDPPPKTGVSGNNNKEDTSHGASGTLLQELHHQEIVAQSNAYCIDELDK